MDDVSDQLPDKVVPVGLFDNTYIGWDVIFYTMFLFNDVMDVSLLRNSLESLVERDGWQRIGARLRRNPVTKRLEYHIPSCFTRDRPAIRFHHVEHQMARADHPIASRIPGMTQTPAIVADPNDFQSLWLHPDVPTDQSYYLHQDEPQLGLFVVSFHDATVVSLRWPHLLFDAIGKSEVLHAWSLMLQGRSREVRTPYGVEHDALAGLGREATEPHKLGSFMLSWLGLALFALRYLFRVLTRRQHTRMVCIPGPFLSKLREKALDELSGQTEDGKEPFLSDGDVLCAWWTQINVAHLPRNSGKLVHLGSALGWRPALAEDILPSDSPYISNAVGVSNVLVPLKDVLCKPLSYLAWRIRKGITESRTRGQIEAYAALWRKSPLMIPPLFGNATMHLIGCSNWSKAKLFELDFSPAIAKQGTDTLTNKPGRPCYVQACSRNDHLANFFFVLGKDCVGNYWVTGVADAEHWASIEEAIARARKDKQD